MEKSIVRRSENFYNFILKYYPQSYRQEFGEEMKFVFSESLKDANSKNGEWVTSFWIRTIIDSGKTIIEENLENQKGGEKVKNKNIVRPLLVTLGILIIPFLGTLFVNGWNWSPFDFVLMGVLIFVTGFVVEIVNMKIKNKNHKIIIIALLILALLIAWVHLAVGIVDTWPLAGS